MLTLINNPIKEIGSQNPSDFIINGFVSSECNVCMCFKSDQDDVDSDSPFYYGATLNYAKKMQLKFRAFTNPSSGSKIIINSVEYTFTNNWDENNIPLGANVILTLSNLTIKLNQDPFFFNRFDISIQSPFDFTIEANKYGEEYKFTYDLSDIPDWHANNISNVSTDDNFNHVLRDDYELFLDLFTDVNSKLATIKVNPILREGTQTQLHHASAPIDYPYYVELCAEINKDIRAVTHSYLGKAELVNSEFIPVRNYSSKVIPIYSERISGVYYWSSDPNETRVGATIDEETGIYIAAGCVGSNYDRPYDLTEYNPFYKLGSTKTPFLNFAKENDALTVCSGDPIFLPMNLLNDIDSNSDSGRIYINDFPSLFIGISSAFGILNLKYLFDRTLSLPKNTPVPVYLGIGSFINPTIYTETLYFTVSTDCTKCDDYEQFIFLNSFNMYEFIYLRKPYQLDLDTDVVLLSDCLDCEKYEDSIRTHRSYTDVTYTTFTRRLNNSELNRRYVKNFLQSTEIYKVSKKEDETFDLIPIELISSEYELTKLRPYIELEVQYSYLNPIPTSYNN